MEEIKEMPLIDNDWVLSPGQIVTWGHNIGLLIGVRDSNERLGFCVQNLRLWGSSLFDGRSTQKIKSLLIQHSANCIGRITMMTVASFEQELIAKSTPTNYLPPLTMGANHDGYLFIDQNRNLWASVSFRFEPKMLVLVNIQNLFLYQYPPVFNHKLSVLVQNMGLLVHRDAFHVDFTDTVGFLETMLLR